MTIRCVFSVLLLAGISVRAQSGGLGSMRDPRNSDAQGPGAAVIQPWLAVTGSYDTYLDQPSTPQGSLYRSISPSGGLSATKSFRRTVMVLGYAGSGTDFLGRSAGTREGWTSSNVLNLSVSSQVARRLTLDFSELGGAANGGFGSGGAGLDSGGLGMLGSSGVAGGLLYGGNAGSGSNPLQNNLVDAEFYHQMTYFSSTSAGAGFLLSKRTMLNISGTASFIRRAGRSYSDSNMAGANAMLSTMFSRRFSVFLGYSFNQIDFVQSIGSTNIQGGFAGIKYTLAQHDQLSLSVNDSYVDSSFTSTVALPPDVGALLGGSPSTNVRSAHRSYVGGRLSYNHAFQRGGLGLSCESTIAPGNDLILLARTQGCTVTLSRSLTPNFSITGLGGLRRLTGLAQAGSRYETANGGLMFSYRLYRGFSLTAGAIYQVSEIRPSAQTTSNVTATAGLYWSPHEGINLF
jgi:hypothetical protein